MVANKDVSERKAFKDYFDRNAAKQLAAQVASVQRGYDQKRFIKIATRGLGSLEFAARVQQFSDALDETLPSSKARAISILSRSLPELLPDCDAVTDGWLQWPVGQFIADHGLEHFDVSMEAMIELTKRFSSEFAVRPFIEHRPEETFKRLRALTDDPSPHVRRWCSEGTRPRLPWGKKLSGLVRDPSPIWPILEALKDDDELYVRRSVANNLNDIAKDHASKVVARCSAWSKNSHGDRDKLIRHALRSLIKEGDPKALAVVGFGPAKRLSAELNVTPRRIKIGGSVTLKAVLRTTSARAQPLLVDFVVHYVRKNGTASPKVFKWKTLTLGPKGTETIEKKLAMKPVSIRALYPGVHRLALQVNGAQVATANFRLTP